MTMEKRNIIDEKHTPDLQEQDVLDRMEKKAVDTFKAPCKPGCVCTCAPAENK